MKVRQSPVAPTLLLLPLLLLPAPAVAASEQSSFSSPRGAPTLSGRSTFGGSLTLGFSSFSERFSIVERDTADVLNELTVGLNLFWRRRLTLEGYLEWENRLTTSDNATRNVMRLGYLQYFSPTVSMRLTDEATVKTFQEGTSFTYSNDFFQNRLSLSLQNRLGPAGKLALRGDLDTIVFEERSQFDYDFWRGDATLEYERNFGSGGSLRIGVGYGFQQVPDSVEIDYRRVLPFLEITHYFGWASRVNLSVFAEQRSYAVEVSPPDTGSGGLPGDLLAAGARPGFWNTDMRGSLKVGGSGPLFLVGRQDLEIYRYDHPTEVYFDSIRSRSGVGVEYSPLINVTVGITPFYGFLASDTEPGEEYRQVSIETRLELFPIGRGWLDLTYEIGKRDYPEEADTAGIDPTLGSGSIYSDLFFHHLGLFASYDISRHVAANLFATYEPERHDRDADDTTAILLSADLAFRF